MRLQDDLRTFKGGSWDLRKNERRQNQIAIAFPDRRRAERREERGMDTGSELTWASQPVDD
jgi:hypothetical protein